MSGLFSRPKSPKIPPAPKPVAAAPVKPLPKPAPIEPLAPVQNIQQIIQEEPEIAARKEKKRLLSGGRRTTILSGIQSALKTRLGQ